MEQANWLDAILTQVLGPMGLTIGALVVVRELFLMFIKEHEASRVSAQEQRDYLTEEADHNRNALMDVLGLLKLELASCNEHRDECTKQITFLTEKCATLQERVDQLEGPLRNILAKVETGLKKKPRKR
jgi:hypothetical protein